MTFGKIDLDSDVQDLEVSVRTCNVVRNLGIRTIRELLATHTETSLLREPNFGKHSLQELKVLLAEQGWKLGTFSVEPSSLETKELDNDARSDVRLRVALRDLKSALGRFEYELLNNKKIVL